LRNYDLNPVGDGPFSRLVEVTTLRLSDSNYLGGSDLAGKR